MAIDGGWITNELLENILLAEDGSKECRYKVVGHKTEAATKKGDNYASEMYRVEIEYAMDGKLYSCTKILKVIPSGEIQRKVMEKNNIFPREIAVYRDILPRIQKLLQSIGDPVKISPTCNYTTDDPKTMLVFDDLKKCGYQMVDRRIGLDLEQTKLVLKKLAKLHACSAIVYQEDTAVMEPVMEGAISTNPNRQDFLIFYKLCARQVVKLVESWKDPSFGEILIKLRNLPNTTIAKGCQVYTRDDSVFNVLNHDDVWISNLMFKYDDKVTLNDVLLLDYQLAYFGSPGVDLNYFLNGSIKEEIREKHWLELIRYYHTILTETLRKLQYSGNSPTLQDIHVEIIRTGFHSVNAVFCLLPLAMMENSENAEMDVFLQESEAGEAFREQIFSNPRYKPILKSALHRFDLLGYFD
uniref:Putative ecdysteroid kinase n=1 Tax=Culex tarsalis TaxID=7177 RepID=A0A1Q3FNC1_CULTA